MSSNRTALLSAIEDLVEEQKAAGMVVDASACATRLSADYPQCGLTLDEIARRIEAAAAERGATLLSGSTRLH
jgi:hypothetical protein